MKRLTAIIESADNNYSAYIEGLDGIVATGSTIDEIKMNMAEALEFFIEGCRDMGCEIPDELKEDYEIDFRMDVKSLLEMYSGIFTKAGLERITGINQKQLWHYANGKTKPKPTQRQKIENAIHKLGDELIRIRL